VRAADVPDRLAGSVALVTGGGRGIGRAVALAFARAGVRVAIAARTAAQVDAVAAEIGRSGGEAVAVTCDVSIPASVDEAARRVRQRMGPVDVLVNNAGIADSAPLAKMDEAFWDRMIAVNLKGVFLCTRACLPDMLDRGWGRVINIASVAARVGFQYTSAYCASKHGVLGFTRAIAHEVAKKGVTVNAICPGWVETDMTAASIARIVGHTGLPASEARQRLEAMNPQGRLIRPDEVANVALFLAGEAADGITGQALQIDGGEVMA
jgi:3-hydroxybutyrate dehydrogenase